MIPKIIHYCWFGPNEYPPTVQKCLDSWKIQLPDYEFKLWNEENFDLSKCQFASEAYSKKKYAFVSDYVRVVVLQKYGGIYLDTDVEVLQSFDSMLNHDVVLGTDDSGYMITSFMATQPGHPLFDRLSELYHGMRFILPDGSLNMTVNTLWLQNFLEEDGFLLQNRFQQLNNGVVIYPDDYFHAKSLTDGKLRISPNTLCVHHHTLLWIPLHTKLLRFLRMRILVPILGAKRYTLLAKEIKNMIGM